MGQLSEKEKEVRVIKILGLSVPSKGTCTKAKSIDFGLHSFGGIEWTWASFNLLCVFHCLSPYTLVAMLQIDSPLTKLTLFSHLPFIPFSPSIRFQHGMNPRTVFVMLSHDCTQEWLSQGSGLEDKLSIAAWLEDPHDMWVSTWSLTTIEHHY